ncbi:hypothetical protein REPUB_Repub20aG0120800 [Reevesia pubescens]
MYRTSNMAACVPETGGNTIFTVFVNNLPPSVYRRWVWQIFLHHGKVVDVFIPKKRNVSGRCFGFVRFASKEDAARAVKNLNGAWLLDYRINVNFARFNPRVDSWNESDKSKEAMGRSIPKWDGKDPESIQNMGKRVSQEARIEEELGKPCQAQHKSYLKALIGSSSRSSEEQLIAEEGLNQEMNGHKTKSTSIGPEKTSGPCKLRSCIGEVDVEAMHNLESSLIGTAKKFYEAKGVLDSLKSCGVLEVSVKKISGNQFLIEFENDEVGNKLEMQEWAPLKEWFCMLQPWSVSTHSQSRRTWVNVFGVLLHVWNYSTFQNIASL